MLSLNYLHLARGLFLSLLFFSCEPEKELNENSSSIFRDDSELQESNLFKTRLAKKEADESIYFTHRSFDPLLFKAIEPTECGSTKLAEVYWDYFTALASDPVATENFTHYITLNRYAARMEQEESYFGADGEYTRLVNRMIRDLERFWDMQGEVTVKGQHNETLNDREKLADILWLFIPDLESREEVYSYVDDLLERNALSPELPESPIFSAEGISTFEGMIIIGDGLVQMFSETGIDAEIVWAGILAHEWAHQIQFINMERWYPKGTFSTTAEETRHIELEADFFASYYMTHKRGATYNWKRVEEFLELYFLSGDCSFDLEIHHGTPEQRKEAARAGYEFAGTAQKKGHILSPEELHEKFLQQLPDIL